MHAALLLLLLPAAETATVAAPGSLPRPVSTTTVSTATTAAVTEPEPEPEPADPCHQPCDRIACALDVMDCMKDRPKAAIKFGKALTREFPDRPAFLRLLAHAYLKDGNPFWAQRTLQRALALDEADHESRAWLAFIHIKEGDLDLAEEVLSEQEPQEAPHRGRWLALSGYLAHTATDPQKTSKAVHALSGSEMLYPEDAAMLSYLRRIADPGYIPPLSMRFELSGGYTSNAEAGSPTDPNTVGSASALARFDLFSKLVLPMEGAIRPALELGSKGHALAQEDARKLSYLELSYRPGVILGRGEPRAFIGYEGDLLLLNQEEKRTFYEGHRLTADLELSSMLAEGTPLHPLIFFGAGRRVFRENGRTRWEADGGAGASLELDQLQLLVAASLRYYDAIGDPYDAFGGTLAVVARYSLWKGSLLRAGVTLGIDYYLHSGGERGKLAFDSEEKRRDLSLKLQAGIWSPSWRTIKAGLTYELSWRGSTAELYGYDEHRAQLAVRTSFDLNPWAPEIVKQGTHVPLDYGLGQTGESLDKERIQDLLRQDESARRGSSCID